ncbi:hypothetical protein D3OALGA1CA_2307 [Olavius algarvensis associated proteobacterium Delta 3]|nr:hypothetical protein D3OALGA1CA_2307 [Olavius algarvensis associated proteobacterium Delta 3]
MITLDLKTERGWLRKLNPIFGAGFWVKAAVGLSIRDVLCRQLGVADDYLDNRVQTLFLDGKPVDDVDRAIVPDGGVLTLSAAMPGLVGATFRKGGHLAPMRGSITCAAEDETCELDGRVKIKLFNVVARELSPGFLGMGIIISGQPECQFFEGRSTKFWNGCQAAKLDGRNIDIEQLRELSFEFEEMGLTVIEDSAEASP